MCMKQLFALSVVITASSLRTFSCPGISNMHLPSVCHISQPFLSSAQSSESSELCRRGPMEEFPRNLPLGQEFSKQVVVAKRTPRRCM